MGTFINKTIAFGVTLTFKPLSRRHCAHKKLRLHCASWAEGIAGRIPFNDEAGHGVSVNGERYRANINHFFCGDLYFYWVS